MRDLRKIALRDTSGLAQLFGIDDLLVAGGLSLAGSLIGGSSAKKAADKAAQASLYAADQSAQVQREALQTAQQNTATSRAAGDLATTALASRLGLIPRGSSLGAGNIYATGSTSGATTNPTTATTAGNIYSSPVPYSMSTPTAGAQDWHAYIAANPDVQAAWDSTAKNNPAYGGDITKWAQDQYTQWGKADGRAAPPTVTTDQAAAAAPVTDVQLSSAAQVPTYTRSQDMSAPAAYTPNIYSAQTQRAPTYTRPEYGPKLDVSLDAFKNSAEAAVADNAYKTIANGTNSQFAATGALQSGAAAKALADRAQANALNYYGQFADRTTGQYNTDRARADNIYNYDTNLDSSNKLAYAQLGQQDRQFGANYAQNDAQYGANLARSDYQYGQNRADNIFNLDRAYGTDRALDQRNYETGRYDTQTGNLFNLSNLGQGAAANYTGAAQNFANNQSQNLFSNAANQGNAALTSAAQTNQLIGSGLSALGYALGSRKTS